MEAVHFRLDLTINDDWSRRGSDTFLLVFDRTALGIANAESRRSVVDRHGDCSFQDAAAEEWKTAPSRNGAGARRSHFLAEHQVGGTAMNMYSGIAMVAVALALIVWGRPQADGMHRKFLRFPAAPVLYPPLILVFFALGLASIISDSMTN